MPPTSFRRLRRFTFRLTLAVIAFIVLLYGSLRIYAVYLAHRAVSLIEEAANIQIGEAESSILPIVAHFDNFNWTPPPPMPLDDCIDKERCKFDNAHRPDYVHEVSVSPFNVFPAEFERPEGIQWTLAKFMFQTPSSWRDPFALRDFFVNVDIAIRAGRVVSVGGGVYVEGHTRWLGNNWILSADTPRKEIPQKAYVIDGTFLTFPGNGGAGTVHYLTPAASHEQFQVARSFNVSCLDSVFPCRCPFDLSPQAFQYIHEHPEVGGTITNEDCPTPDSPNR